MSDRNKEIFDEVQAQINVDARKNEEYFARMDQCIKRNQNFVKDMQALNRRNYAVWRQFGIDLDKCEGRENPFLFLEKLLPEVFSGMSKWVEKSRKAAREEAERLGCTAQKMKQFKDKQKLLVPSQKQTITDEGRSKKSVRRVRI